MPLTPLKHIPEPILWHEGMLLIPEHFEELTARQEELLQLHASVQPFHWGVTHVQFDESQLLQGRIVLLELEAIMPDGFFLWVDREAEGCPQIDLETLDPIFKQTSWLLHLAMLKQESKTGRRLRYVPAESGEDVELLPDVDQDGAVLIPRMQPSFQLIPSQTPPSSRYVSMPVARICFNDGVWKLMENYLPPARRVDEASLLGRRCTATVRRIREFAVATHARWRGMSARERAESRGGEVDAMRNLVAALPPCEALMSTQSAHPFQLYLMFCSLAGHIAGLASEQIPPVFSSYQHDDVLASFAEVDQYIHRVLGEADTSRYVGFPFVFAGGVFSLNFVAEWFGKPMVLALRGRRENDPALIAWGEQALIGTRRLQPDMRGRRVLGAQRKRMEEAHELFAGVGAVLFALEEDPEYLVPDEPLDIASGPASGGSDVPLSITLYVLQNR